MMVGDIGFALALLTCAGFAIIFGGRAGKAGSVIVLVTSMVGAAGPKLNSTLVGPFYAAFAADIGCLIALFVLATRSSRLWPIWAVGFQIVAVATHIAAVATTDVLPSIYYTMQYFWNLTILLVMVSGTLKDHKYEKIRRWEG
jgi:hypothetical protein